MQIGAIIKRKREDKRLSQQEVAEFIGVTQRTYSNIESDKSFPTIEQLSKLSELLKFDPIEHLKNKGVVFYKSEFTNKSGYSVVNNYSEKLIVQYEARIKELQEIILLLKEKINKI